MGMNKGTLTAICQIELFIFSTTKHCMKIWINSLLSCLLFASFFLQLPTVYNEASNQKYLVKQPSSFLTVKHTLVQALRILVILAIFCKSGTNYNLHSKKLYPEQTWHSIENFYICLLDYKFLYFGYNCRERIHVILLNKAFIL